MTKNVPDSDQTPPKKMTLKSLLKTLGPGILFACTAIGVSHLVQSTRAGANYGFALLWAVLAANIFKYPFFEFGSRYANAMGESLIDGYNRIGKWMLGLYFLITIGSMFFVGAAVVFVTAGFCENLFGLSAIAPFKLFTTLVLLICCVLILWLGKYSILDSLIKIIGAVLLVSTLAAFVLTLIHGPIQKVDGFLPPDLWDGASFAFLIALMGWMPTAVDLSTWNSLWTLERIKQTGYQPSLKETLFDFNFGYWVSAVLSICFVTLGAFLIYGSGTSMPGGSAGFASKVIALYTTTIGSWSYLIIASAAFSIMFGTCIGVLDGYSRALERTAELVFYNSERAAKELENRRVYVFSLFTVAIGAFVIISLFADKFKILIDLATTISFLIAPVIAIVNYRLVTWEQFPVEARPGKWLRLLSLAGIVFLTGFSLFFIYTKLFV